MNIRYKNIVEVTTYSDSWDGILAIHVVTSVDSRYFLVAFSATTSRLINDNCQILSHVKEEGKREGLGMNIYDEESASVIQTLVQSKSPPNIDDETSQHRKVDPRICANGPPLGSAGGDLKSVTIGLVDCNRLTRECLANALRSQHPEIQISSFGVVQACMDAVPSEFDLIIYCLHDNSVIGTEVTRTVTAINRAAPNLPVLVFSYSNHAPDQTIIRSILESGACGFVPAHTATLSIIWAAIDLVNAGGIFLPPDLMLANPRDVSSEPLDRLTSRQSAVFNCLRLGKANKIIAYELGMREATVKVHVRNIMRKVGATNRTQAAYKGQRFLNDFESARMSTGVQTEP